MYISWLSPILQAAGKLLERSNLLRIDLCPCPFNFIRT
jgi:hypothetical protein